MRSKPLRIYQRLQSRIQSKDERCTTDACLARPRRGAHIDYKDTPGAMQANAVCLPLRKQQTQ